MSGRDWRDFDEQLDRAIDALNHEQQPEAASAELESLIDTVRVVRQLRPPAEPDEDFVERLVRGLPATDMSQNGAVEPLELRHTQPLQLGSTRTRRRPSLAVIAAALRTIGICVLAGMIAGGLIGGLGGRAVMRVSGYMYEREHPGQVAVTQSSDEPVGQISLRGTWDLVVEMTITNGLMGGLMYLVVAPYLPRRRGARGVAFAVLLLLASGWLVIDSGNIDFRKIGSPVLNIAMFSGLILAFGLAVPWIAERLTPRSAPTAPRGVRRVVSQVGRILVAGLGAFGLFVLMLVCLGFAVVFAVRTIDSILRADLLALVSSLAILPLLALIALRIASLFSATRFLDAVRRMPHYSAVSALLVPLIVIGGATVTLHAIVDILAG